MLRKIDEILSPFKNDQDIIAMVVYRIDGTPIYSFVRDGRRVSEYLYFLESQVRDLLYHIFTENLDEISLKIGEYGIKLYPISKTLVLSMLVTKVASFKVETDAKTIIKKLQAILLDEFQNPTISISNSR